MEQNNQKMVIKKRKLENDSSEESDSEDSEDEDTENHKSFAVKEFLRRITQMNAYLFMIYDVLYHMMNETKQQTFLRDIRDGRVIVQSSTSASVTHCKGSGGGQGQEDQGGRPQHGGRLHQGTDHKVLDESRLNVLVAKLAIICYTCICYSYIVINQLVNICTSCL